MSAISLKDAGACGEYVAGSGSASKYVVVLHAGSMNVAARYRGGKLSIRVEPSGDSAFPPEACAQLQAFGLSETPSSHYSVHFPALSYTEAVMSLFSVLAGISAFLWQTSEVPKGVVSIHDVLHWGLEFGA